MYQYACTEVIYCCLKNIHIQNPVSSTEHNKQIYNHTKQIYIRLLERFKIHILSLMRDTG